MYIIIPILTIPSDKNLPRQKTKVAASHKQIKKKRKKAIRPSCSFVFSRIVAQ